MSSQSITIHFSQQDSRKLERLVRAEERKANALERIADRLQITEVLEIGEETDGSDD